MSSPPPEKPKWYSYWPMWRRIMMSGAVILLIGALVPALMGANARSWVPNATLVVGYGFLAYGFFLAMKARKGPRSDEIRWTGETKDGWTAPDDEEKS